MHSIKFLKVFHNRCYFLFHVTVYYSVFNDLQNMFLKHASKTYNEQPFKPNFKQDSFEYIYNSFQNILQNISVIHYVSFRHAKIIN